MQAYHWNPPSPSLTISPLNYTKSANASVYTLACVTADMLSRQHIAMCCGLVNASHLTTIPLTHIRSGSAVWRTYPSIYSHTIHVHICTLSTPFVASYCFGRFPHVPSAFTLNTQACVYLLFVYNNCVWYTWLIRLNPVVRSCTYNIYAYWTREDMLSVSSGA